MTAGAPSTLQLRAVSAAAASGWPEREWSDDDSVCIEAGRRLLLHAFALDAYGNRCDRRAAAAALDGLTVTAGRRPDAPPPPPPATPEIVAEGASCKALPPGSGAAAAAVAVRLSLCGGAGPAVLRASSPASGLSGEMEVEVIGGAVAPASCDLDSDGLCIATAGCRAALRLTARDAWGNALDASTLSEAPRLRLTAAAADAADADSAAEDAADFDGSSAFECGPTAAERESAARNARTSARAQPDGSFALAAVVATAGEYNLAVSFGRDASPLGPPTRLRVLAGRPQALKLIVPPAAATCGEAWGPLVVFAVDAHGNPVRGAQFSPVVCEAGDDDDGGGAEAAGRCCRFAAGERGAACGARAHGVAGAAGACGGAHATPRRLERRAVDQSEGRQRRRAARGGGKGGHCGGRAARPSTVVLRHVCRRRSRVWPSQHPADRRVWRTRCRRPTSLYGSPCGGRLPRSTATTMTTATGGGDGEELECELIDSFCKASAAGVRGTAVVQLRVSNATPGPIRVTVSSDDGARVPRRSASVSLQLVSGLSYYAENPVVSRCLEERSWAAAMLKHGPSLLWTVHAADVPFNSLSRGQLVNHFPSNSFTTKVGIADCLRNSSRWLADADPASFFPRCYDLSDEAQLAEFTSDFHRTAASAVLKRFVAHGAAAGGGGGSSSTGGFVPLRLASAALQVVSASLAAHGAPTSPRGAGGAAPVALSPSVLAELATFAATPEPAPAAVAAAARAAGARRRS